MPPAQQLAVGVPVFAKFETATVLATLYAEVSGCGQESVEELRKDLAVGGFCGNIVDVRRQLSLMSSCRSMFGIAACVWARLPALVMTKLWVVEASRWQWCTCILCLQHVKPLTRAHSLHPEQHTHTHTTMQVYNKSILVSVDAWVRFRVPVEILRVNSTLAGMPTNMCVCVCSVSCVSSCVQALMRLLPCTCL